MYMPNISKLSKFLRPEGVKDGDVITFLDEGVIVSKTFKKEGQPDEHKDTLEITVDFKGEHKTYSPNGTSLKLLGAEFGGSTEGWIGKKAKLFVVPASNGKDMIVAKPIDAVDQIEFKN